MSTDRSRLKPAVEDAVGKIQKWISSGFTKVGRDEKLETERDFNSH
jgi:hypothetical protein